MDHFWQSMRAYVWTQSVGAVLGSLVINLEGMMPVADVLAEPFGWSIGFVVIAMLGVAYTLVPTVGYATLVAPMVFALRSRAASLTYCAAAFLAAAFYVPLMWFYVGSPMHYDFIGKGLLFAAIIAGVSGAAAVRRAVLRAEREYTAQQPHGQIRSETAVSEGSSS